MARQQVDYHFRALNPQQYELTISMPEVSHRLFRLVYNKTKSKYEKKKSMKVDDSGEGIDKQKIIVVPVQFYNLLKVALKSQLKDIDRQLKADKIEVMTCNMQDARYVRKDDTQWEICFVFGGVYIDKR